MTIKVGDKVPAVTLKTMGADGPKDVKTDELFAGKKAVLFAVPGAFTPGCSMKHVPGYVANYNAIKAKGIDLIACLSVNDAFVMGAWGKDQQVGDKIVMLADGNATFANAVGLTLDGSGFGLGLRSQRYAMVLDNGVVKELQLEAGTAVEKSSAELVLALL